jgi:arsenate reductase
MRQKPLPGQSVPARASEGVSLRGRATYEVGDIGQDQAMKATIYHNPNCGTSRKTLEILRTQGADVTVIEYLKNPPAREELKRLYERAGIAPSEGLRAKEQLAADLGLTGGRASEEAILDAMVANPILINRPLVETDKGVRLCRPQEIVREIL